jgi:Na+/proline symporter
LTSIYHLLGNKLGTSSRKTGAWFFLLSKLAGSAAKLYLVCLILQQALNIPFPMIVIVTLLLIWLYTRRGGICTLVWTDALQTLCMLVALVLILLQVTFLLHLDIGEAFGVVWDSPHARIFEFEDWSSRQHFVKQFLSGIFVVIVMTGLDQDMMQKNLTCKSLRDGQKDLCSYGILFLPVNFLFLALGVLLMMLYTQEGMTLPSSGDALLPSLVMSGMLGQAVTVFFTIGIIAAAFSSADSALTALTTIYCIDILEDETSERRRKRVHISFIVIFMLLVLAFKWIGSQSVIDLIYTLVSYTYGPLLGLFAFALLTHLVPRDRYVPLVAILSPALCFDVDACAYHFIEYRFGYEMLMLNGCFTFLGLFVFSHSKERRGKHNGS